MVLNLNSMIKFNIANIKLLTKTEGPYKRCCIWFQGCNLNCKGCCNQDLQKLIPKNIVSLEKLVYIVKQAKDEFGIEGITLSGGEPSIQNGLAMFNKIIRDLGLGIIMFSGKEKSHLNSDLVNSVDLLIAGPFIKSEIDNERLLLGSKNKKLHCISDRYRNDLEFFNNPISKEEVIVQDYIFINGD